ncbi:SDR family oxidoreductase [Dictyobacter aurantiacus]|uniref:3-ketoacyl-ACP reductase n=1 Tax=Dictyobacter aurantiacus TaxID=1936993 RepID=A0A401ZQL5_9CHLR|nr:SDR family oxidoreductase [Dictyobacter aurantiacus]GCE09159.1 3-ketoacyl-ACP reductase [Dictyobacter aurantiacus]
MKKGEMLIQSNEFSPEMMERHQPLKGKVALVTGASQSIGRAIAERLSRDGASVILHYRNHEHEAQQAVEAIRAQGGTVLALQADLTERGAIEHLFEEVHGHFGRIDIVVANAGVPHRMPIIEVTEEQFDQVFAINTRSVFFMLQEAARRVEPGGRLVVISSSTTYYPTQGVAVYAGSKAASKLFVEVMAQEIGQRQVTVNSVLVGATDSGFLEEYPLEEKQRIAQSSPMGRLGTPQDTADVVAFLASYDARWISGQHILTNGAAHI